MDKLKAMQDLNMHIQQLTKLILTSQTVDELKGGDENGEDEDTTMAAPESPAKIDFDESITRCGLFVVGLLGWWTDWLRL